MTRRSFYDKVTDVQRVRASDLALLINPRLSMMPLPMVKIDDPFLPFGKAIIDATRDLVCAYVFDLASYLALGAAGAVALERSIAYAGGDGETVTILHAPFATPDYREAASERAFNVDAVTLASDDYAAAYLSEPGHCAFVVANARGSVSPGAGLFIAEEGLFFLEVNEMQLLRIRLLGEAVLYAGSRDDFAEQTRAAVTAKRQANG